MGKQFKRVIGVGLVIVLAVLLATGCTSKSDAKVTMEEYLNHIIAKDYEAAYENISNFDKDNISEESFVKWQEQVAKIIEIKDFSIDNKVDVFKEYKYLGTTFETAYGLKIYRTQKEIVSGIELDGYNQETHRIMVVKEQDEYRVLLLLTDLDELVATYDAFLKEVNK